MRKIKPDQRALNAAMAEAMQRALDERPDVVAEAKRLGVQAKFKEAVANMGPLPTEPPRPAKKTRTKCPDLDAAIDRQLAGGVRVLVSRHVQLDPANAIINPAYAKAVEANLAGGSYVAECKEGNVTIAVVGPTLIEQRFVIKTPMGSWTVSAESLEKIASAFYAATDGPFALHKRGQGKK